MHRLGLIGLVLALGGCNALRDAFSAHPSAAARAAGQILTVDRLAEVASRVKGMPLQQQNVSRLAGAYVDFMLFALVQARGEDLDDTVYLERAMWPTLSNLRFNRFVERVSAARRENRAVPVTADTQVMSR